MSSTNKTSLGLNMWEPSDKPVRQDFVNDNRIINEQITKLNSDLATINSGLVIQRLTSLTAETGFSVISVNIAKYGKVIVGSFRFSLTASVASSAYRKVTSLPSGFVPTTNTYLVSFAADSALAENSYIDTSGNIYYFLRKTSPLNVNVTVNVAFGVS